MKAIIIARVSSKEQEDTNSIPAQVRNNKEYAERHNFGIINTYQLTESSTKANRTKFNKIIDQIKRSKEPVALVVDTVDRLQRDFRESVKLNELRENGKLEIHFVREGLIINKASNSADILRWDMAVLFAKGYVTQLTDNIKRGQKEKIKNGEWLSKAPFGYRNVKINEKKWIEPDENAHIVAAIFRRYASGAHSMRDVRSWVFDTYGVDKKLSQIQHILTNPFYAGKMKIKDQLYVHRYTPIVSQELFDSVQQVASRFNRPAFKFAGLPFHYKGLIVCGDCGRRVTAERKKGHVYYHCTQYDGNHGAKYVREEEITNQLTKAIRAIRPTDEQYNEVVEALKKANQDKEANISALRSHATAELTKIGNRTKKLLDIYLDEEITQEEYKIRRTELNAQKDSQEKRLLSLDKTTDQWYHNAILIMELVRDAPLLFEKCSIVEQKRLFIKLLLSNLELHGSELRWKYKKPFDSMVSNGNCPMWCCLLDVFRNDFDSIAPVAEAISAYHTIANTKLMI